MLEVVYWVCGLTKEGHPLQHQQHLCTDQDTGVRGGGGGGGGGGGREGEGEYTLILYVSSHLQQGE